MSSANPLISTTRPADSTLYASLHPLVLLTISDYITRHSLRRYTQPIVGALLGQHKGREITIEHAYDVKLLDPVLPVPGDFDSTQNRREGEQPEWRLHESWFADRLQQYKDVHKDPALELVGWWTLSPPEGPGPEVLGIHRHVLQTFNETSLLLAFHPASVQKQRQASGAQTQVHNAQVMPLTIYESVYETKKEGEEDADKMQVEDDGGQGAKLELKLRELPYEIVTGEAEMISVDFVAKGGGNATEVETGKAQAGNGAGQSASGKGKGKAIDPSLNGNSRETATATRLNPEEEELVSFLSSRANAIKMLQSRLSLLRSYLHSLPSSYLTDPSLPTGALPQTTNNNTDTSSHSTAQISHQTLRSLLALTSRLPHLQTSDTALFARDQGAERSDVAIVSLLGSLGRSVAEAKELGRVFCAVDGGKGAGKKEKWSAAGGGDVMMGAAGMGVVGMAGGAMDLDGGDAGFGDFGGFGGFDVVDDRGKGGMGWDGMV